MTYDGETAVIAHGVDVRRLTGTTMIDPLRPAVGDIPADGLGVEREVTAEEIGLEDVDERLAGPVSVNLEVRPHEGAMAVGGTLEGKAVRQCVRCLTDYEDPLFVRLRVDYLRHAGTEAQSTSRPVDRKSRRRGQEAAEDSVDEQDEIYYYQGDHIDLTPMLREQIILAAPMQPLCKEDCAGLCPTCGQNWNDQRCACQPAPMKSPFRIVRERHGKGGGDDER
jgi:uncharacterized protein